MRRWTIYSVIAILCITAGIFFFWRKSRIFQQASVNEVASGTSSDPQYIFVRKSPTCQNCIQWNGYTPDNYNDAAFDEVINTIGTYGTPNRRVGIGAIFSPSSATPTSSNLQSLRNLLAKSQSKNVPVYILLDGNGWIDGHPEIWNWWDPNQPGYNPDNKNNVEWTCWDSSCAIKEAWRNWGMEFEVKPQPNLASPAFIQLTQNLLKPYETIIADWYNNLPENQKYLFGGISTGGEVDIGANYYYYPNGVNNGSGLKGSVQLGYAALKAAGIKSSGTITSADLDEVVRRYLTALNQSAVNAGIPREKIYNHVGGKGLAPFIEYPPNVAFIGNAATNKYAQPGWSFYGDVTANPKNYPALNSAIDQIGNTEWAVPEWLSWASDLNGWIASLRSTLNYRNNRFVNVSNWEDVKDKSYVIASIRQVANESPSCWVNAPVPSVTVSGNVATISWQKGSNNDGIYLLISTKNEYTATGILAGNYMAQENVTQMTSKTFSNIAGTYYYQLIADGCGNQRRIHSGTLTLGQTQLNPTDYNGKVVKGSGATAYYVENGKIRQLPDWDTFLSLHIPNNQMIELTDAQIALFSVGAPYPSVHAPAAPPAVPGDLTGDGHVTLADYNKLVGAFGNPYTLADYNKIVANFGV